MRSIPVITYHHVNCHQRDTVTVTPEYFEEQMRYLSEGGYKTVFLEELISFLEQKEGLSEKMVALTIDDGYFDNWLYAYPVLKKYRMKATIFIITSLAKDKHSGSMTQIPAHSQTRPAAVLGKGTCDYYLSWAEMREMEESGLVDIQSHTHTHKKLVDPGVNVEEELSQSKAIIEKELEKECEFISWPWGVCNQEIIALARRLGYRGGVVTFRGTNSSNSDPMRVKRFDTEKGNIGWFSRRLFIYSHATIAKIYLTLRR